MAALTALLRNNFVKPVVKDGESARKRMEDVVADSGVVLL